MKILEKILVATDLSQATGHLLETARFVAKSFHSEIHLLHVISAADDPPLALEAAGDEAAGRLEQIRAAIGEDGVQVAPPVVATGPVFARILEEAERRSVNAILMGSGRKPAWKIRLGTTTERAIRRGDKSVWLVEPASPIAVRKILCPVDFSAWSRCALRSAVHLSRHFRAELMVLNVVMPVKDSLFGLGGTSCQQPEYTRQQEDCFVRFLKGIDFHNVNWRKVVLHGRPEREILGHARGTGADLLIMGAVGRTGSPQVRMGRVAQKIIREMPCSVIAVKQEGPIHLRLEGEPVELKHCFQQGKNLLERGFSEDAVRRLQHCIEQDMLFVPAWEALASAYSRLNRERDAREARQQASNARRELWERQVVAEIRTQLPIWGGRG